MDRSSRLLKIKVLMVLMILLTIRKECASQAKADRITTDTLYYNRKWVIIPPGNHVFYRVATFHADSLYFVGEFTDYYRNGNVLEKGMYDGLGKKEGLFERYYSNGNIYSSGSFQSNEMFGLWAYYYENGKSMERIAFNESDYAVIEFYGVLGNHKLKNGTGKWQKPLKIRGYSTPVLNAEFKEGVKVGTWKVRDSQRNVFMKESYENGVFRIGLAMDKAQNKPYNVPIITKEFFESKRYAKVEQFKFDQSVNRTHYSYFDFLSKPMVRTITRSSNDRTVFTQLENNATPVGGMQAFYQSIAQNIIYPAEARRNGTEGNVYVKFIVEKDGRITNVEVLKGIGDGCDEEAIEAVKMSPPWNPGLLDGVPQRQGIVVPVVFRLGETAKPKPNLSPR